VNVERVAPDDRLRVAVLADFEGPHARSWLRYFIDRGHDVHAVSFYPPRLPIDGATMHHLRPARGDAVARPAPPRRAARNIPRGVLRLAHALRYQAAGLRGALRRIGPDVFHAHYLVEHGFYGALAGVRPLVVTAWGSDALVEPRRDPISRWIARFAVQRADLVTSNNAYMGRQIGELGALPARVAVITLGADRYDLERADDSVNRCAPGARRGHVIISTRAHERLYNIGEIIDAYSMVAQRRHDVRLVIAHGGSQTPLLRERAANADGRIDFRGVLDRASFRDALADAEIFVSIPSSDATSVALLQAMAAGAFPIVSDLPTQREWIRHGINGFLAPLHDPATLARLVEQALEDAMLRRTAADLNRRIVEERGLNELQMRKMEEHYYRLAARTMGRSINRSVSQ
jgi:glycosyltransferase involved in cell wall biosynthesis